MMPLMKGITEAEARFLRQLPVKDQIELWNKLFHTEPMNRSFTVKQFLKEKHYEPEN